MFGNVPSTSESSCFCDEGNLHLNAPRDLTEWIPTNGLRPNARLSLTRMLIGGEYISSTGKFYRKYKGKDGLKSLFLDIISH